MNGEQESEDWPAACNYRYEYNEMKELSNTAYHFAKPPLCHYILTIAVQQHVQQTAGCVQQAALRPAFMSVLS